MFSEAKDNGGGGDNWTTGAISRAKLQSNHHHQTNTQLFYRPDALPVTQPTVSKHWMEKYHIPWTCLPQAHLGVFQLCLWPLRAPGYLGEGCHASHQPSDASTPTSITEWYILFPQCYSITNRTAQPQHHSFSLLQPFLFINCLYLHQLNLVISNQTSTVSL